MEKISKKVRMAVITEDVSPFALLNLWKINALQTGWSNKEVQSVFDKCLQFTECNWLTNCFNTLLEYIDPIPLTDEIIYSLRLMIGRKNEN